MKKTACIYDPFRFLTPFVVELNVDAGGLDGSYWMDMGKEDNYSFFVTPVIH